MKVLCIDDSLLPIGAELKMGVEYEVQREFINSFDERTYILKGNTNSGTTKTGLMWYGYKASRFVDVSGVLDKAEISEELVIK